MTETNSELLTLQAQAKNLRESNRQLNHQLQVAGRNNKRLAELLESTREQIVTFRQALERDGDLPFNYGTVLEYIPAEGTEDSDTKIASARAECVEILHNGRKMRVAISPLLDPSKLQTGQEVLLNDAFIIVAMLDFESSGEVVRITEVLSNSRVLITTLAGEERIVNLSQPLRKARLRVGDAIRLDPRSGYGVEQVALTEVQDVVLEEVPDISYEDIGGLADQIEHIKDAVELPFHHPELYREHGLKAPKGILLYGPPGNGKTLIAKAVARSLADRAAKDQARSFFLNIKGPELLNKYVGETERHIRVIFARAREKASEGYPVVVFFDEMDSLFRTRGTGVSSDVENTIVPQLLAEIDGVEKLENVIVIGASNREDMLDPAILRPGRLDVKIRVQRPDADAARDIFAKHLTVELPLNGTELAEFGSDRQRMVESMIEAAVKRMYQRNKETEFLELLYADGTRGKLYHADFVSGAVIANIVDRAKKHAIKDYLASGKQLAHRGISTAHVLAAVNQEFRELQDLPNTSNPDEWARLSGLTTKQVLSINVLDPHRWE